MITNWNTMLQKQLVLFSFLLLFGQLSNAQCTISGFTVTKTNATCFSNAEIKVGIPTGQTGCETRFATITPVTGTSNTPVPNQTQTLTFSTTGGDVVFGSLPAGKYNVAVSDGITTTNYASNPVTLTSTYIPMTLSLSSTAPTCTATSTGYVQNGTFTATITGGTGPFEYKLTSAFGVQTFSSSSRTQVFNNIKAGENVTIVVTDKVNGNAGCQVSVTQNYVTSTAVPAALAYGFRAYNFIRDCADPSQSKIKFFVNLDNLTSSRLDVLQQPGNAKITIAGVDYPLTYVASRNGYTYNPAAVNGPELVHGMSITTSFNWGCSILTRTSTVQMPNNWFNYSGSTIVTSDCSLKLKLKVFGDQDNVQGYTDRNVYFCPTNSVKIEKRISTGPDIYQELSGSEISPDPANSTNDLNVTTDPNATIPSAYSEWLLNEGGYYRITVSDQYHTVVTYYNAGTLTNPLGNVTINPTVSVLAGTSGFSFPVYNSGIKYPVSVKVERTDGQTLVTHTAVEPLSLAGTYTYNFPMFVTWNADPGVLGGIYDLPPGEYRFTLTDACSNTKVFTSTNATYANYTPNFTVTQGCNNSNSISFNLNKNGFAFGTNWGSGDVILYTKNASGGFGSAVQSISRSGNGSGTFVNLASGSYFVQFNGIGLGYSTGERRTSPTTYFKEVVIPDYQNFTVSTGASICDTSNPNTGIISAQITGGTYTYPITFSLFSTSNSAAPIATYVENNTSKVEHSFTNLSTGNYFVRVASSCYSVDQNVSISTNVTAPRAIVSDPVICPLSPTTLGAISATNGLYDITWTNDADPNQTVIATGMPVVLSPAATIKYRATFKLKDFLACVNPPIYTSTVDVRVDANPDVSLAVSDIDLCLAPATKTVTISSSQLGYKYEIVTMNGASFVPPLSGTGTGGNLVISFPSSFNFAAGTTLRVKTSNGANSKCTDYLTDLVTITQSTPIKTLVVQSTDVCQGFASSIKVKASQSQIVYLIKKNGVPISSIPTQTGNGSDLTFTIPANQLTVGANTFTVQASNSTCGTIDLDQAATITVTASPVSNAGTAFIKTCITNPNGKEIGMTAVSGINYSWSPSTGLNDATIANPIANPTATTTYTLTAADGTCTAISTVKATVITTVPLVNAGTDFTKTCSLNPTGLAIGAVIQGQSATYSWTPTTGLSSATNVTPLANPTETTTYRVTATETSSGCTNFDEVVVTVDTAQPNVPVITSIVHPTCSNSKGTITITSTGNLGDMYSIDNGLTYQLSNVYSNLNAGDYNIKIKRGTNGCISNALVAHVNAQPPTPSAFSIVVNGATTFCDGGYVDLEGPVAPSGDTYSYQWFNSLGAISSATTRIFRATLTETYTLVVTNTSSCSRTASAGIQVQVNNNPIATINNGVSLEFLNCTNTLTLTASQGSSYQWVLDGVSIAAPQGTTRTFTATTPGSYKVTVTDNSGCIATSEPTLLVPPPTIQPTSLETCEGNPVVLNSNVTSFTDPVYQWKRNGVVINTGGNDANYTATQDGDYTVQVTERNNSSRTATSCGVSVMIHPLPIVNAGADFTITCLTNPGGLVIGETPETGFDYVWSSPNGVSGLSNSTIANPRANPTVTTTYTIRKTNQTTLCWKEDSITITVDTTLPVANAGADFTKTCVANTSGKEIGVAAISGVTYSWSPTTNLSDPTSSNPIANPTSSTTYTLMATNPNNGCTASNTVVVTVDKSTPVANAGTDFTKTCATNPTGKLIGSNAITGVTYSWLPIIGLSDATIANPLANPSATTTYTLIATKTATGCTASASVNAIVNNTPIPVALSSSIENTCPLETVNLETLQSPAVNGIIYEWWTGTVTTRGTQITNPRTYSTPGTIYLWSKTANEGCYSTIPSQVNVIINVCCMSTVGQLVDNNNLLHFAPANIITLDHINYPTPSVVRYVIVNDFDGKIKQINTTKPEFIQLPAGNYTIHALVFGPTVVPTGLTIGNKLSQVQPSCGISASIGIVVQSICSSAISYTETLPSAKQYALLDSTTNQFVQVNTNGIFEMIHTGIPHQVIGFNYTGTATGIQAGGTIAGVSATNLDITAGAIISGCTAVTTQIDGIIYNDKDKRCIEGLNDQQGLPAVTLYAKLLNSNNQVVSVSSAIQAPYYTFSMSPDLLDGTYSIILDDNNRITDAVATYPNSWKGNAQTFTIELGQIVEYLSNTANFVPMCLQSATNKPILKPTANLVGNTYNYCQGAITSSIIIDALPGAIVNWYAQSAGGVAKTTPLIPDTSVVGTTTCYVSQTLNGAESDRAEVIIAVHALPERPIAIAGNILVGAGTSQNYYVVNSSSGLTYNWILPTDWTGTSSSKDITVQVGTQEATIGVTAISSYGCVSPIQQLDVRVVIEDDIEVYNSISPNGDGVNDIFRIRNIDFYPENTLSIYNRWGIEVFHVNSYGQNDNFFKGFSDGRSTVSRDVELPEGTYFYTLTYKNTKGIEKNLSGYLYIKQ
jgi:gliding motility-associated-like protein